MRPGLEDLPLGNLTLKPTEPLQGLPEELAALVPCSLGDLAQEMRPSQQRKYRLLMNTELAVGEIALECGFPDSRSFAKAFRRRYGMTPAEYRKKRIKY